MAETFESLGALIAFCGMFLGIFIQAWLVLAIIGILMMLFGLFFDEERE